jgi:hypothetical protein
MRGQVGEMTLDRVVSFKTSGPTDQSTLDQLREALRLKPEGRPSDAWDEYFGRRVTDNADGQVKIQLVRDNERPGWNIDLYVEDWPARSTSPVTESEINAAIVACGLTITEIFRLPVRD